MEGPVPLYARIRWRRRGAWMWPAFAALTVADTAILHLLPMSSDSESTGDALLTAIFLNLLIVAVVCRPVGLVLRRRRPDLPAIVARDHAATAMLCLLAGLAVIAGIAHRPAIAHHRAMLRDAIVRAQAYIGDRAPAEFRQDLDRADTVTISTGIYRTCVPGRATRRQYCVVVQSALPLAASVRFSGYESNETLMSGAG